MVFSSIPAYLDPPNWHQQPNHHHHHHLPLGSNTTAPGSEIPQELPPLPPPPTLLTHVGGPSSGVGVGSQAGSIRPNSISDRARLAKIPHPETPLKCPRCESTSTKFCYFNNYSLTQPRHFCKTCRRYWTRGGALRNVPVGGGCRRNKKSKGGNNGGSSSSRSKSPVAGGDHVPNSMTNNFSDHLISPPHHLPLLASSIQGLGRYGGAGSMGLNFNEMQQGQPSDPNHMGFQFHPIGGGHNNNSMSNFGGGIFGGDQNQWRNPNLQQVSFLGGAAAAGFESSTSNGLYPFHQGSGDEDHDQLVPPVKVEDNHHGARMTRPSLGTAISENDNNNNQFWGGNLNAWTDLSGLNSSSASHLL